MASRNSSPAALTAWFVVFALASEAQGRPSTSMTDVVYWTLARCVGLGDVLEGRPPAMAALMKSQGRIHSGAAFDIAEARRDCAAREARKAGPQARGRLNREYAEACRRFRSPEEFLDQR